MSERGNSRPKFAIGGEQPTAIRMTRNRGTSALSLSSMGGGSSEFEPLVSSLDGRQSLAAVLSALYAVILIILALAFEVSIVAVDEVHSTRYDPFYLYLYGGGLLFFGYCYAFLLRSEGWKVPVPFYRTETSLIKMITRRADVADKAGRVGKEGSVKKQTTVRNRVTHSSRDAGSMYLRLGCVVFGVVALISNGFELYVLLDSGSASGCFSESTIAETSLATLYIFMQMFFIFQNSKLTIHRFTTIGRFGTMHLIATNLCMWIRSLVIEEWHVIHEIKETQLKSIHKQNLTIHPPSNNAHHHVPSPAVQQHHQEAICAGKRQQMATFISDAKPFMITCFIEYSLICSAVMYVLWRNVGRRSGAGTHMGDTSSLDPRAAAYSYSASPMRNSKHLQVDCSSSTRGLFLGLLFMIFTIISMIIFFTKINSEQDQEALWVFYASDGILYIVAILSLCLATKKLTRLTYIPNLNASSSLYLDDILLIVGLIGQLMICVFSVVALDNESRNTFFLTGLAIVGTSILRMIQVLMQTVFILFAQRLVANSRQAQKEKPGRELVTFLLMTNLSMFLINTFQAQKAAANPLTSEFYGRGVWAVIVHSTVPLCTFYRFHSTVCLAEIWKTVYRTKVQSTWSESAALNEA